MAGHEHQDKHGHDKTTVIVNGRPKKVDGETLIFEQVVALAYNPVPSGDNVVITVTYSGARGPKDEGILSDGESVAIKNGMHFYVKVTNKS